MFVRFQSAVPNRRGSFPGVFAMANGLHDAGMLSPADEDQVRVWNAHAERIYTDPSTIVAACFDPTVNPGARSWFKDDAAELLQMAHRYTALLDRHEVPWAQLRTTHPGRIVYEDAVQVVAVAFTHEEHWPLEARRNATRTTL